MAKATRIEGVDVARGLAGLLMLQGHAYSGWASPAARDTAAYGATRLLGTFPLPAFLLLAGVSVALRVDTARRRAESAGAVRAAIVRRGFTIVLVGYAVSFVYAAIDGSDGLATLLRADVLHVIGLSLALLGAFAVGPSEDGTPSSVILAKRAALVVGVLALASPWVNRLTPAAPEGLRYLVALFGDVPGVTRMPLFPLGAWMAMGVVLGVALGAARDRAVLTPVDARVGARPSWSAVGLALSLALALAASVLTSHLSAGLDHPLSRRDPAVWANVLDLGARGAAVLFAGLGLSRLLPAVARRPLLLLGRYSLWAYVFHIPFCYGRLGFGLRGASSMTDASVWLIPLGLGCLLVTWLRERAGRSPGGLRHALVAPARRWVR